jgi:hypothetical protein
MYGGVTGKAGDRLPMSIAHGAKVDVVWRARIGNLGAVTYIFEVQMGEALSGEVRQAIVLPWFAQTR